LDVQGRAVQELAAESAVVVELALVVFARRQVAV
jgi:hypothetical protein